MSAVRQMTAEKRELDRQGAHRQASTETVALR